MAPVTRVQVISPDPAPRGAPTEAAPQKTDPRQEYVAGGLFGWYQQMVRALPWSIDDLTATLGDDIYDRMLLDSQVAFVLATLKTAVLAEGITLTAAIKEEDDPDYDRAQEVLTFCQEALKGLRPALETTCWSLLDALAYGHKMAELVWEIRDVDGVPRMLPKAIKVKPRHVTAFAVDAFDNIVGILALIPGQGLPVQVGAVLGDSRPPNLLPREKFAILTFHPKDSDPRGQSLLRPAYSPWWDKQQLRPEYLAALSRYATPILHGTPAPEAQQDLPIDPQGPTPETSMMTALQAVRNGSVVVTPPGSTVEVITTQSNGAAFLNAFTYHDKQITQVVLLQTLASTEGQHQARAAANTHENRLITLVRHCRQPLADCLEQDVLRLIVLYNYGPQALAFLPKLSLGEAESTDVAVLITALAAAGYALDASQLPAIDQTLGLPVRTAPEPAAEAATDQGEGTEPDEGNAGPGQGDGQPPGQGQGQGQGQGGQNGAASGRRTRETTGARDGNGGPGP